ncbi:MULTISPECIES: N-acetyltransferase [Microbacterium]|uniref:GNAT family N-acetyltransferase n=1 Tax=Microbacterium TaxID=33882 RepID=UPI00277FB528|nr:MULTISPECIES: GNAT family N-acetyltransferase [Microbacterium]MDQ1082507.1 ribosomal protein S18 acetylase RimI-like enzyme [Microbacterium sp. SORGH_AS_0344]MDQ1168722.1 ribosomal protein S18 acetylase RimI-like enzyme [Microbacterium proteolyticum]
MDDSSAALADADVAALLRIQRAAYQVEAGLIGDERIPALHETEVDLRAAALWWIVDRDSSGSIRGAIAFHVEDDEVDIHRLVVDPTSHRLGIGRRLVRDAMTHGSRIVVSTGLLNGPARNLYEGLAFTHVGDREVIPGLWVSDYRWERP